MKHDFPAFVLLIDAMDLLHSRRFEGFCLVSSDSDFTRLATRIREDGLVVFSFCEKKAPKAFVNACDRYIYVENLLPAPAIEAAAPPTSAAGVERGVGASAETALESAALHAANAEPIEIRPAPAPPAGFKPPALATELLMRAYTNVADDTGWALLGQLSSYLHANHFDFDQRTYGCAKFIDLIQKTAAFELVQRPYKKGQSYFCRPSGGMRPAVGVHGVRGANGAKAADGARFRDALLQAVAQATGANGWAPVSAVGQRLKAMGGEVKGSGYSSLTDALTGVGLFEAKGSGAARYFRLKAEGKVKEP